MNESVHDHENLRTLRNIRVVRAVMASVCVMGLAGMMWLHGAGSIGQPGEPMPATSGDASQQGNAAFLHAPATDSSIPRTDQIFAPHGKVPAGDEAVAPTF